MEILPAIVNDMAGSQFMIEADDLGLLDINSPVYYRRIPVRRITSYQLRKDGKRIDLQVFIDAPYDRLITADSRFWNVSGVGLSVGSDGFQLKTQTIAAIMAVGIAFSTPDNPTMEWSISKRATGWHRIRKPRWHLRTAYRSALNCVLNTHCMA